MLRVSTDDGCLVLLLVVRGDFNLPRSFDHVEVGEDMAFSVDDKSRTLPLLRHCAIEKVIRHGGRGDVYHRGQSLLVDRDVLLLFGVIGGRRSSLSKLHMRGPRDPRWLENAVGVGGEIVKAGHENDDEYERTKFHTEPVVST